MAGDRSMDAQAVTRAFEAMGRYLRDRQLLGEIAVYGGSAILLQFDWRKTSKDVDAVVRDGHEGEVKDAVEHAAAVLGLRAAALLHGGRDLSGRGDARTARGRRKSEYPCAMKLKALERETVDNRDFEDAVGLGLEIGIETAQDLQDLYAGFFPDEQLNPLVLAYLPEVAGEIRRRRTQ